MHLRRLLAAVVTAVFVLAPLSASAAPSAPVADLVGAEASAADEGFVYWGFYRWDEKASTWGYMDVGANDPKQLPEDGDVYGFRWAVVLQEPRLPRADGDFDTICEFELVAEGENRIAFVLDYGADYDAQEGETPPEPRGVCTLVSDTFTVQQALQTVAEVRTDDGLVCAIDSYPSEGCGGTAPKGTKENPVDEPVVLALPEEEESEQPEATGADDEPADGSGGTVTLVVALAVVAALVVGGLVLRQRRR